MHELMQVRSARVEALPQLSVCLSLGIAVVSFDFSGSGLSEGEYVTLGAWERLDIRAIVAYLREEGAITLIIFAWHLLAVIF